MCVPSSPSSVQVDYGQGKQAFNPSTREPVYQQIEKAKQDNEFAQMFAADIMLGKEASGGVVYGYNPYKGYSADKLVNDLGFDPLTAKSIASSGDYLAKRVKDGYLYNENTLNASKSWVPQTFGAPAVQDKNGNWYQANLLANGSVSFQKGGERHKGGSRGMAGYNYNKKGEGYGFIPGAKITDAETLRLLNEGHYAFSAKGFDGSEVYVPWAKGYAPKKGYGGKPEAGNYKKDQEHKPVHTQSGSVGVGQAQPGNIIGGKPTLLGDADKDKQIKNKTLLGG